MLEPVDLHREAYHRWSQDAILVIVQRGTIDIIIYRGWEREILEREVSLSLYCSAHSDSL